MIAAQEVVHSDISYLTGNRKCLENYAYTIQSDVRLPPVQAKRNAGQAERTCGNVLGKINWHREI